MRSEIIVKTLDSEFDVYRRTDLWGRYTQLVEPIREHLTPGFRQRYSGLMFDFTEEVEEILTTVFMGEKLLNYLVNSNKKNVLIFTHHPFWQNQYDYAWTSSYPAYMDFLQENRISVYSCHMPLDLHPRYSTDYYFSQQLIEERLGRLSAYDPYFREMLACGYYGVCKENIDIILKTMKPDYGCYLCGSSGMHIVACSPGGGGVIDYVEAAKKAGADTYITGVCVHKGGYAVQRIIDFFTRVRDLNMNLIELSHYSTEQFVMRELPKEYFSRFDCQSSFFEE